MDNSVIFAMFVWIIIFLLGIRYVLIYIAIRKKSILFLELKKLNHKYKSSFQSFDKKINIRFSCRSLQQYRNNCNKTSIINYMCGRVRENEEAWKELYDKANHNKNVYEDYLDEYEELSYQYGGDSYQEIRKKTFLLSEKQYLKFEVKYCKKKLLKPQITLNIIVKISYTSPAGRNRYETQYQLKNESIDEIFARIEDRKISERSIDYQRALMTSGKRYDILRRDHYRCQICGRRQSDGAKLEVDHIIPVSKGGKTVDENLQTLCHECNQGKKAKM